MIRTDDGFVIRQNKLRGLLYILGTAGLSILCLIFFVMGLNKSSGVGLPGNTAKQIILLIGFVFFGYGAYFFIKKMKSGKEVLIIDRRGITDNSSAYSLGLILWEDIETIYIDSMLGNKLIEVKVRNEQKYLKKAGVMKRKTIEFNKKSNHQIVCITLNGTGIDLNNVLLETQQWFGEYKKITNRQ